MVRNLMAVAAVSGLMVSTALAEMKTDAKEGAATNAANLRAITAQQPNQWLGSTLIGMAVVDPHDNTIGEVNDLLVDKGGKVEALIIGVGGFLGIGDKDVALPMSAFTVVPGNRDGGAAAGSPATKPSQATSTTDRLRLSMTKDQLKQHAEFRSMSSRQTTGSAVGDSATPPPKAGSSPLPPRDMESNPSAGDKPEGAR